MATASAPSQPVSGQSSTPTQTTGQAATPAQETTGQSATPAQETTGQAATPAQETTGQSATPAQETTGQAATPAQETTGQAAKPAPKDEEYKPEKDYVKLKTNDEHEFCIPREWTLASPKLQQMMSEPPNEKNPEPKKNPFSIVDMINASSHTTSQVCEYFAYYHKYKESGMEVPVFPIKPDNVCNLLVAANFLEC